MNLSEFIFMMMKKYSLGKEKYNCAFSLLHFLIKTFGYDVGGSKSKLAKHGENWEKVISGLFFLEGVGSTLSVEIQSFLKSTNLIRVSCFEPI